MKNNSEKILRLVRVLQGPGGCNWDRAQTPLSLAPKLIEESHEAVEAIETGRRKHYAEEIGDLLFLVLSLIRSAQSRGWPRYETIIRTCVEKYVSRHPHVFGPARPDLSPDEIFARWEKQKTAAGAHPIGGVPRHLPALYQAKRILDKAARAGLIPATRRSRPASKSARRAVGRRLLRIVREAVRRGIDPESALRGEIRRLRRSLR